jgi:hypothetical protein
MEISRAIPQVANSTAVSPQQSAVAAKPLTEAKQALAEAELANVGKDLAYYENVVRQQNGHVLTPKEVTEHAQVLQKMDGIAQELMKEAASRT